jgi:hypothetical protein
MKSGLENQPRRTTNIIKVFLIYEKSIPPLENFGNLHILRTAIKDLSRQSQIHHGVYATIIFRMSFKFT